MIGKEALRSTFRYNLMDVFAYERTDALKLQDCIHIEVAQALLHTHTVPIISGGLLICIRALTLPFEDVVYTF